jgi:predicted RNase H-like HicB family nuclease
MTYNAVIEKCNETGYFVGYVPGFSGAHSQGETKEELLSNLKEVIELILEGGEPEFESEFIGLHNLEV